MKKIFKLNFTHQFKCLKESLSYLLLVAICFGLFIFFTKGSYYVEMIAIGFAYWFITSFIFVLPLHIQYLRANWDTELTVDPFLKKIEIKQNGSTYSYKFSELKTLRYLGNNFKSGKKIHHKHLPTSNYAYVKIKTVDGKLFIITSLMADPFNFPLEINNTQNGILFIHPDLTKQDRDEYKIKIKNDREDKIEHFMQLFQSLSTAELQSKLEKKHTLVIEAAIATERILEQRK